MTAASTRLGRAEVGLVLLVAAAGLTAGRMAALWQPRVLLVCPFLTISGHPCPTCGGTRAMIAVAHGELFRGLAYNPLVALAGIGLWALLPIGLAVLAGWLPPPRLPVRLPAAWKWLVALLVTANWVYLWITWPS